MKMNNGMNLAAHESFCNSILVGFPNGTVFPSKSEAVATFKGW
jgi:hypothetical protein